MLDERSKLLAMMAAGRAGTPQSAVDWAKETLSVIERTNSAPAVAPWRAGSEPSEPMAPNPAIGLRVELPQMPGLDVMFNGRRAVAELTQEYMRASDAAIIQALMDRGAKAARAAAMQALVEAGMHEAAELIERIPLQRASGFGG